MKICYAFLSFSSDKTACAKSLLKAGMDNTLSVVRADSANPELSPKLNKHIGMVVDKLNELGNVVHRFSRAPTDTTDGGAALLASLRWGGGSLHALPSLSSEIVTVESVSRLASTYAREIRNGVQQCVVLLHVCRIVGSVE